MSRLNPLHRLAVLFILLIFPLNSCSGGSSPVDLSGETGDDTPRQVLSAFADACIAGDIPLAESFMLNPLRWHTTLDKARDVLPLLGHALKDAPEMRRDRDVVRYRMRLSHPDDPQHRILENVIFVGRFRGMHGETSHWGVDFVWAGNGDGSRRNRNGDGDRILASARSGQWGTNYTHASILSRAIIAYYTAMYPEDTEWTGPQGYFKPLLYQHAKDITHPGPIDNIIGIDYDIYNHMPPDALLIPNVPGALVQAGSCDEDVFVGELNGDGSVNFIRKVYLDLSSGVLFASDNSFGSDDDTFFKGFSHFLTPVTQDTWETDFSAFNDFDVISGDPNAAVRSLDWALGVGTLGPFDVLGMFNLRASKNLKTFPVAVSLYNQSKNAGNFVTSVNYLANAFYTFGYVLHLLQDAGCPAHCRNDMHGVPYLSSIPGLGGLAPDPMEDWGESITQSFVTETIGLYTQLIQQNNRIERNVTGFPGNPVLQNLYNTAGHSNYRGVEALFEYTSLGANRMCFSEDTIYVSTNSSAANTNFYPDLTTLNLNFFGKTVLYGVPGSPFGTSEYLVAVGNGSFDLWRSWFWTTHWFTDPNVNDVEDALHNDWDILTVADGDDEDYFSNGTLGVREQQWRLMFPHIVRTGAALMHEFYLETH